MSSFLLIGSAIATAAAIAPDRSATMAPAAPVASPYSAPAAGQKSPPVPRSNPDSWTRTALYPPNALTQRREGNVEFVLHTDLQGEVKTCAIAKSSGSADLDAATCDNLKSKARFYAAQNDVGAPTEGRYSGHIRWQIPAVFATISPTLYDKSFPRPPRITDRKNLNIQQADYPPAALAQGLQGKTEVTLRIDPKGLVRQCSIAKSSGHLALDQQSCALAQKWRFNPAATIDGTVTDGVLTHRFDWRAPKAMIAPPPASIRVRDPLHRPGSMTLTMEFDKGGTMIDCDADYKGEIGFLPSGAINPEEMCRSATRSTVAPFVDKLGKAESRRVKFKIEVEHEDVADQ